MMEHSMIPEQYHIFSGSALKLIAVITMMVDHMALLWLHPVVSKITLLHFLGRTLTLYSLMRLIGRISFPIFCFLIVEGFLHTRDRRKYGTRLLFFALISEIPWDLAAFNRWFYYPKQNVFFTLLLGYLALCVIARMEKDKDQGKRMRYGLLLLGLLGAAFLIRADYGVAGFAFIIMLYLARSVPPVRAVLGCCMLPSHWRAGLAMIPISLYNGKRGFVQGQGWKLFFYVFYPAHLVILFLLRRLALG